MTSNKSAECNSICYSSRFPNTSTKKNTLTLYKKVRTQKNVQSNSIIPHESNLTGAQSVIGNER